MVLIEREWPGVHGPACAPRARKPDHLPLSNCQRSIFKTVPNFEIERLLWQFFTEGQKDYI